MFLEIAPGPILLEGCQVLGNRGVGVKLLNANDVTIRDSIIANNSKAQILFEPQFGRKTGIWNDQDKVLLGTLPIPTNERTILEGNTISTIHQNDAPLLGFKVWGKTRPTQLEWQRNELTATGNTYWAPTEEAFDAVLPVGPKGKEERVDLAQWQELTGQDVNSTWSEPKGITITAPAFQDAALENFEQTEDYAQ